MHLIGVRVRLLYLFLLPIFAGFATTGFGQVLTDSSDGTLSATLLFGVLTPGSSNTPDSTTVQFRVRDSNAAGYNVQVTAATFTPTLTASVDGGSTIAASDIGVGIISVTPAPGFNGITPRSDSITSGFDYDPATVNGTDGLTPYGGLGGSPARATLQDLISAPNVKVLSGNQIHTDQSVSGGNAGKNYLTVTIRLGLLRQYFTPATFYGSITLQISNGR